MPETTWSDGDVATATLLNQIEDQIIVTCTSGTRPTGTEGRMIYETDTNQLRLYSGSAWVMVGGEPNSFTPALTAVTTDPTLGSGSSATGYYSVNGGGGLIQGNGDIVFGTSGTNAGSGAYRVSLPSSANTTIHASSGSGGVGSVIGAWSSRDDSSSNWSAGIVQLVSATTAVLIGPSSVAVTSAVPWAWAASDSIRYSFQYYAA